MIQMSMKKINAYLWKLFYFINEKHFTFKGHTVNYLFKDCKSDKLCVVFSAFPLKGTMPGYNYVRTLWNRGGVNLLYICDDMVKIPTGGSYYLGNDGDYWGIEAVEALIKRIADRGQYNKKIAVGSSKGGTAALIFGIELNFDAIIIGACQYKIGTYLNCDYHYKSLQALTGMEHVGADTIKMLDSITEKTIHEHKDASTEIWFHYSTEEHTYKEQIQGLLADLRSNGYELHEDIMRYSNHADVAKYFPEYLEKTLDYLLKEGCN